MSGHFSRSLVIEEVGYERWEIVEPFSFFSATGLVVDVSAGFTCDLASIPAIAQSLVSKLGYWTQPAVVHDLLYYRHRSGLDNTVTRMEADLILLEGCKAKAAEYNVPAHARRDWLIFGGVVAGSEPYWLSASEKAAIARSKEIENGIRDL